MREPVSVTGVQVSLPKETEFLMRAKANKPLVRVRIQYDPFELAFGIDSASGQQIQATLTRRSEEGTPQQTIDIASDVAQKFVEWHKDRTGFTAFTVPFVFSDEASDPARQRIANLLTSYGRPFVMRPDNLVRMYLEDTDDIISTEPARLKINGIIDQPPGIDTELKGIGSTITRLARIPIGGLITDDYGVVMARFEYKVDKEDEWHEKEFLNPPQDAPKDYRLQLAVEDVPKDPELLTTEDTQAQWFRVLELDLSVGRTLTLTVVAQDGDDLNGPNVSRSEKYVFKIVSRDELLNALYQKELNLRQRFEQIIAELKQTQADLTRHRTRVDERTKLVAEGPKSGQESKHQEKLNEIDTAVTSCAERSLHGISKNHNETASIEESFKDIREEMINNAVHTPQMLERMDNGIIIPLHGINTSDYTNVDEALRMFKFAIDKRNDPTEQIDESLREFATLIEHMEQVLLEMKKLETFQEALKQLRDIISDEEKLIKATETLRKKKLIDEARGDFDDDDSKKDDS